LHVAGPGVVPHDRSSVLGIGASRDEGAAMFGRRQLRRAGDFVGPVIPGGVIRHQLIPGVEKYDVGRVERNAARSYALDNAFDLFAILAGHLRPQYLLCTFAKERVLPLGVVRQSELDGLMSIVNFRRKQIAVLESNLARRSSEPNRDPPCSRWL